MILIFFWCSIYTDTRETSANALNAASAFQGIVDAIDDANNASRVALEAANEAQGKVSVYSVGQILVKIRSTSVLQATDLCIHSYIVFYLVYLNRRKMNRPLNLIFSFSQSNGVGESSQNSKGNSTALLESAITRLDRTEVGQYQ